MTSMNWFHLYKQNIFRGIVFNLKHVKSVLLSKQKNANVTVNIS